MKFLKENPDFDPNQIESMRIKFYRRLNRKFEL